jgi:hypothetical protein
MQGKYKLFMQCKILRNLHCMAQRNMVILPSEGALDSELMSGNGPLVP